MKGTRSTARGKSKSKRGPRAKSAKFDPRKIKRLGILTGGGDCPGLNAVIRGVVRAASNVYGWEVHGIPDGFDGLVMGHKFRRLTSKDVRGLQMRGGTILGTSNRGNPMHYPVKQNGETVFVNCIPDVVKTLRERKMDVLIAVGGDGTLKIAQAVFEAGFPVFGIPKTIDNDLSVTDVTFGFNSAVDVATEALDRLHTTAESHHRIMVLEVMGRDCGWIALNAGIAGGADVILIPEIPFDLGKVCDHINNRKKHGSRFSIAVVAEGASPKGGSKIYEREPGKDGTPGRLGGIGRWVANQIGLCTKIETRVVVLGHTQRGGSPTTYDRILATHFGVQSVRLIAQGNFGNMAALKGRVIKCFPIKQAVMRLKRVNPNGQQVLTAEALGIELGR